MSENAHRTETALVLNFTGRVDIASSDAVYKLAQVGDALEYSIRLKTIEAIRKLAKGDCRVSLVFSDSRNVAACRREHGLLVDRTLDAGVLEGTIPRIGEPDTVRLRLILSDPVSGRIKAQFSKPYPDSERSVRTKDNRKLVDPNRLEEDEGSSIVDLRERTQAHPFDLDWDGERPILWISKVLGKRELESNSPFRAAVYQSTFVELTMALALAGEAEYPWGDAWRLLAASFSPDGSFESFADLQDGDVPDPIATLKRVTAAGASFAAGFPSKPTRASDDEDE